MGQVSFSDLIDGVIHTAAHHNDRFNALKSRINAIQSDNLEDSSVTGPKIAMGSDAQGDILIRGVTSYQRLAAGTSGQFLKTLGAGANPLWATISLNVKVFSTSRARSAGNGTQAFTGLGGTPKFIIAIGMNSATAATSQGFASSATAGDQHSLYNTGTSNVGAQSTSGYVLQTLDTNPNGFTIAINSFDADGFTIGWTSVGASNGTTHYSTFIAVSF